jgi:methylmalonyl-CoA decarboxylase subunit alpha
VPPGADSEADALYLIRKLLSYLPQNNMEDPPFVPAGDDPLRMEKPWTPWSPTTPANPTTSKKPST